MRRKILKAAALAACLAATAASAAMFGIEGASLAIAQLSFFAIWVSMDSAEREKMIIEEAAQAVMKMYADKDARE